MDNKSTQKQSVDKVFDKNRNQPTQPQQPQREEGKPEQSPQQKQSKRYKLVRTTESVGNTFSAALKLQQVNTTTIAATSASSIKSSFTTASTEPSTETPTAAQAAIDAAQRLKDGSTDVMGGGFAIPPPTASSAIATIQQLQKQHGNLEAAIVVVAATTTTNTKITNAKTVSAVNKATPTPSQMQEKLLDHIQTENDDDQKRDKNSKVKATKKQDEVSTAITSKTSNGRPASASGKSKISKESRGKFADKLRRSFRRGEHKSLEIKRPEYSLEGLTGGSISANHVAHRYSPQETNSSCNSLVDGSGGSHFNFGYFGLRTLPPLQRSSQSIFSLTHLPGLSGSRAGSGSIAVGSGSISSVYSSTSGGHINPALLLDSPDADTPPEYAYHHLSSVATTNSSTSLESNFGEQFSERTPSQSSISYWAWQQSNSSMGGEVSTSSRGGIAAASGSSGIIGSGSGGVCGDGGSAEAKNVSDWKGKEQHEKQKLQSQSSSKSDAQPQQVSRSCSITSDSSSTKLTRLQNFLFKSSNESTRSFHAHSKEAFTASSHNSSSGEWENLGFTTTSGSGSHVAADFYVGSFPEESDDDNGVCTAPPPTNNNMSASGRPKLKRADSGEAAGSYYQYTLTSPNNPFLPEIIARTYHSAYDKEDEPLDDNVTAVKYGKSADAITTVPSGGTHSAQLPTPAYSRAGSQESTHSDSAIPAAVSASSCSPALHTSSAASSSSSTPGRQRRKLFILNSPTRHLLHQQPSHKQQQQQQQSHAATDAAAVCKPAPSTFASSGSSFIKSLNPFLPAASGSASNNSDGMGTTSAATTTATTAPAAVMGAATKRVPLKQSAVTSPIAVPQDLNAKREEFLRATMKICLVVSPPTSKLQLKSKSLTHLDGLDSMVASPHSIPAGKATNVVTSSEYFSVSFCTDQGVQEEEFIPATKGVTLYGALSQALKRRNLSFSQITITDNNPPNSFLETGYSPLASSLDENTDVENLAGHYLIITERDGSRKTLQKAASFGSRTRPPRLLSSASTEETSEAAVPGKQLKQRWSGLFGIKNPQQSQLCELLNNYAKNGVPQKTASLNFDHPDFDAALEYLDNMHKSWKDIVDSADMNDNETRIQTAIWELVTTEVYYIHALQTVTDLFLACLEAVQEERLLTDVDQHRLFSNVRDICEANLKFWIIYLYPMVAHSIATREPLRISFFHQGFVAFASIFAPYKKYCAEQSTCQFYCKELNRNNPLFTSYLAWCESQKMCNRLRLADIIVRPMQRLTKYSLLLAAIKKHMSDVELVEAVDTMIHSVENFVFSVNNHLTTRQENERLKGVMARIESYDVVDTNNEHLDKMVKQYSQMFDLCAPMKGCPAHQVRHLFMEGDHKFKDNLGKADVHCFLLTDMLLVCKAIAKRGLGSLKVIRQPYLTDRLVVQQNNNVLNCVYLNEFQVAITAFTLQCSEAKNWYESLKRAKMIYTRLKQGTGNWDSLRFGGSGPSVGTVDSLGVKKSPMNSSICSHVSSANNSHSGSVEWNDSRNISVDFEKTNSLSSEDGSMGKNLTSVPLKLKVNTASANTLSVQPLNHLGQSLPNLNLNHSHTNNTLLVPGTTTSHSGNLLLSPSHRGISYPPPSPTRVPLRRGMAFSTSTKNPPLVKTRNITSQNSFNWPQIQATSTSVNPHQLHNAPGNTAIARYTPNTALSTQLNQSKCHSTNEYTSTTSAGTSALTAVQLSCENLTDATCQQQQQHQQHYASNETDV
ncbi:serine-rich adhesin for platelets-like isoform X2 [Rhagoletis pomonella]|uniref:serine-rich adhesin for platelets-like isoform X2 n=1 Tax=Rhagoletis pomonella TaxID=28610 RepID=UPI0017807C4A|nr:serine-rich adhesin for platelets-like isoform X2 [Rhagoletis pomonella]